MHASIIHKYLGVVLYELLELQGAPQVSFRHYIGDLMGVPTWRRLQLSEELRDLKLHVRVASNTWQAHAEERLRGFECSWENSRGERKWHHSAIWFAYVHAWVWILKKLWMCQCMKDANYSHHHCHLYHGRASSLLLGGHAPKCSRPRVERSPASCSNWRRGWLQGPRTLKRLGPGRTSHRGRRGPIEPAE